MHAFSNGLQSIKILKIIWFKGIQDDVYNPSRTYSGNNKSLKISKILKFLK